MSLEFIIKTASVLDATNSEVSVKAATLVDMAVKDAMGSKDPYVNTLQNLYVFAGIMDYEGQDKVADQLTNVIKVAVMDDRPMYDTKKHKEEAYFTKLEREVSEPMAPSRESLVQKSDSLSTRHSPELPGVMMMRVADGVYQDPVTKKVYDFNKGWVTEDGEKYPGGSVSNQTAFSGDFVHFPRVFESNVLMNRPR